MKTLILIAALLPHCVYASGYPNRIINNYHTTINNFESSDCGAWNVFGAVASIPDLPHKDTNHPHDGIGAGVSHANGCQAIALKYQKQVDGLNMNVYIGDGPDTDPALGAGIMVPLNW